jgi:hypothetical protein
MFMFTLHGNSVHILLGEDNFTNLDIWFFAATLFWRMVGSI